MKILKKHKYKFLTLMLSIVSIFTLFIGINKTYAYETNQFTYTIDTTNETFTTKNDINGIEQTFGTSKNYTLLNSTNPNEYLLINYYICYNGVILENNSMSYGIATYNNGRWVNLYSGNIRNTTSNSNYMYTSVIKFAPSNYNTLIDLFNFEIYGLSNSYSMFIVNMDYVNNYDIGLQQYYETYYGQIEDSYNALLSDYNTLQNNYDTLETNYNTLQDNYNTLESNYNNLNSQVESLQSQITTLQAQKNTIEQQLEQINEEYNYIINQVAPFNPTNIQSTSVIFNNTNIDIPYNSFVIFDYFQIELDLMDFDLIQINYNNLIQSINNKLTITLNLQKPITIDNLEYWCSMRDFYNDCLNLTLLNNENIINEYTYMNNEHQDSQGDMAPYYISSGGKLINRLVFEFVLNDYFYNNYQGKIDYMIQSGTYTQGYNDGLNASNQYIDKLKNEIEELNNDIDTLDNQLLTLQAQYDDLNDRYNRISNPNNTLYSMVVSIADVPLHVFKQIFNFDILGINISTFVLSLVSLLIIIWLIKKII